MTGIRQKDIVLDEEIRMRESWETHRERTRRIPICDFDGNERDVSGEDDDRDHDDHEIIHNSHYHWNLAYGYFIRIAVRPKQKHI